MEIHETALKILTSEGIADNDMTWDFIPSEGRGKVLATCTWNPQTCTDPVDSHYEVTRPLYNTSVLTIEQNNRTKIAGNVRCGVHGNSSLLSCKVGVVCKYDICKSAE